VKSGRWGPYRQASPHRPGTDPALGLRADRAVVILSQTNPEGKTSLEPDISEYSDAWLWNTAGNAEHLLSQLVPGLVAFWLGESAAINVGGAIVANGVNSSGQERAFLLTPVPAGTVTIGIGDAPAVTEGNTDTRTATFTGVR
jgi:hypothetical protein